MAQKKYPIGVQTFSKIIEGGFAYVDKTAFIEPLVNNNGYYFLSRPRRFGKSLLLSTLHAYFEGRRDLFKGLALDNMDVDWTPRPVLHFDLNSENFLNKRGLELLLDRQLREYEKEYGINEIEQTVPGRFAMLIKSLAQKTNRKVAILIDEYDKPLLAVEEHRELFEYNQALLKGFFGNLKSMNPYIHFALLTGVARFNRVSIFSDINNLHDISLSNEFSDICGWTEEEFIGNSHEGIDILGAKLNKSFDITLESLRSFYDGYLFSANGSRLYNPYTVMVALSDKNIEPHWYITGTPSFLARRLRKSRICLPDLDYQYRNYEELLEVGMNAENPVALMFQTGYLTIDRYDEARRRYYLRFPNKEVQIGFAKGLYPYYVMDGEVNDSPFFRDRFQDDLFDGEPERFMDRLRTLFKKMPYEMHNEDNYRSIVWLLCTLIGTDPLAERHSYKGRSDIELRVGEYIYVFEFKYNESDQVAMTQLLERDYAGHYALDSRKVFLIGVNFDSRKETRGLTWKIEEMKR